MKDWEKSADIVIIGGGILGISTAYYLAKHGHLSIVLLEKDLLSQASTGLSVGGIRQQFSLPINILLSQETIRLIKEFEEEWAVDLEFKQVGYLFLAQEDSTWQEFQETFKTQQEFHVPTQLLSPNEIRKRWPYLEVSDLKGGSFCPEDGYMDPYHVAMSLVQAARKLKVKIWEKTKVVDIGITKGHVQNVKTSRGKIVAPVVVNAAGAWAQEIGLMAGIDLPIKPYRRQVFATKPFAHISPPIPMIIDQDPLFYFRGDPPGLLMGMTDPDEPSSYLTHIDRHFLEKTIERAIHRAPILSQAEILRGWGGLYACTPDENPILGKMAGMDGFWCAAGYSGHGFQHGLSSGNILSELILKGATSFDLTPLALDRFQKPFPPGEKRTV